MTANPTLVPHRFGIVLAVLCMSAFVRSVSAGEVVISTVAGTGRSENNGDRGTATAINIGWPFGVEIGPDQALYITECIHHRVRRLDRQTGRLTTVAGSGARGWSGDGGSSHRRATEPTVRGALRPRRQHVLR